MAYVIMTCSTTGKPVNTGVRVDYRDFVRSVLENNVLHCPICGRPHVWNRDRVRLEPETPAEAEELRNILAF
jgi:hypothetical protein